MTWQHRYAEFRERFAEAMDPAFYTIEYLDWLVHSGAAGLFFADNAAIVVEIKDFPGGARAVHGICAAGDLTEIVDLIVRAEAWGMGLGCTHGMIESRPGWARIMKSHGYAPHQISLVKEL